MTTLKLYWERFYGWAISKKYANLPNYIWFVLIPILLIILAFSYFFFGKKSKAVKIK